jgi:uncharacterized repeat protein (TIGR03803 family)
LASFNGNNGMDPESGLIADASGNLYGMTSEGGADNEGTLFEIVAGTHALTSIATFNGSNGTYQVSQTLPYGYALTSPAGELYTVALSAGQQSRGFYFGDHKIAAP